MPNNISYRCPNCREPNTRIFNLINLNEAWVCFNKDCDISLKHIPKNWSRSKRQQELPKKTIIYPKRKLTCEVCGKEFKGHASKKYCDSEECKKAVEKMYNKRRTRRRKMARDLTNKTGSVK